MKILGIESSCDETAVALFDSEQGLLRHVIHSQIQLHQQYGGVVPELASRDHSQKLLPLVNDIMQGEKADAVAYTAGPGLAGALLVGAVFARTLAYAWNVPAIPVHHMEGHLLAPMLETEQPRFPYVALLVSGGHSLILSVNGFGQYEVLGQSIDDAAGEAFDKTARLLGLPYPGGPEIARLAELGRPGRFNFPRPMLDRPGLMMSFSGLKTAVSLAYLRSAKTEQDKADIAYAFQEAVVGTLVEKCRRALQETGAKQLVVAGGVGANRALRTALNEMTQTLAAKTFYPRIEFCTDNAAMIAYAACCRLTNGNKQHDLRICIQARWPLTELESFYVNLT